MTEENYIRYRRLKAFGNSVVFFLMRIFPVDRRLVSVCTFEGKGGFGCNPKYVVKELHKRHPECRFVWLVNRASWDKNFPPYIKKVNNSSLLTRAYYLSRSKIWIDNYRKPYGTLKRRGQYYLNVNHYTIMIKCTGLLRGRGFSKMAYLVSRNDSDMIDDLVIDSAFCENCFDKALVYSGDMLKAGSPRCDVLYGDREIYRKKFRKKHGLPDGSKIVMFAPTFREGAKDGVRSVYSEVWSIDFKRLIASLEKKTGDKWYICIRVHPQLAPTFKGYTAPEISDRLIDESQADDMYEVLAGMDAYITDYSSAVFEAGFAGIPSFIYADDIARYTEDRGSLMWDMGSDDRKHIKSNSKVLPGMELVFPFSVARDNDELENDIGQFDRDEYDRRLGDFKNAIGLVFDGRASERVCERIEEKINHDYLSICK